MLINDSIGVLTMDKAFLALKSLVERKISANKPNAHVMVASVRPKMVRN